MRNVYAHSRDVKLRAAWKKDVKALVGGDHQWCRETLNNLYDQGMLADRAAEHYKTMMAAKSEIGAKMGSDLQTVSMIIHPSNGRGRITEFTGTDKGLVELASMICWGSFDEWLRDTQPVTVLNADGLYHALVREWSAE
jgi:hypothetical protein